MWAGPMWPGDLASGPAGSSRGPRVLTCRVGASRELAARIRAFLRQRLFVFTHLFSRHLLPVCRYQSPHSGAGKCTVCAFCVDGQGLRPWAVQAGSPRGHGGLLGLLAMRWRHRKAFQWLRPDLPWNPQKGWPPQGLCQ